MSALLLLVLSAAPSPVAVGSKVFTESVLLGELATQVLVDRGLSAEHRHELGGTRVLWEALLRGDVDVYPEYTGTLSEEIFAGKVPAAGLEAALAERGVVLGPDLGFDDTYALGVRRDVAQRLGLVRISDLRAHPALRLGFSNEPLQRGDGWLPPAARVSLPQQDVRGLEHGWRTAASRGSLDVVDPYRRIRDRPRPGSPRGRPASLSRIPGGAPPAVRSGAASSGSDRGAGPPRRSGERGDDARSQRPGTDRPDSRVDRGRGLSPYPPGPRSRRARRRSTGRARLGRRLLDRLEHLALVGAAPPRSSPRPAGSSPRGAPWARPSSPPSECSRRFPRWRCWF